MHRIVLAILAVCAAFAGCGTTRWSDTARTATEQILLSDSMDRAISRIDFRALAGKKVFLDDTPVKAMTDAPYLVSAVRQHIMASGGILKEKREEADYIVEVRAGAIGTDRHDLLFGVPALTVPTPLPMSGVPSQIPEIPFVKRTDQRGVARVSLFIYNRESGRIVWQSGLIPEESKARATWVFGAGPFQRGTIYNGTKFAGDHLSIPLIDLDKSQEGRSVPVSVAEEAFFVEPSAKENAVSGNRRPTDKTESQSPPKDPAVAAPTPAALPPGDRKGEIIPAGHTAPASSPSEGRSSSDASLPPGSVPVSASSGLSPQSLVPGALLPGEAASPDGLRSTVPAPGPPGGVRRLPLASPSDSEPEAVRGMDPWPLWRR